MAFDVQIAERVALFIQSRDRLTVSDQERIFDGMKQELGSSADQFFELNQIPQAQDLFWYDFILMTESLEAREFRFVCDANGHVYGVTEVQFAEEAPVEGG